MKRKLLSLTAALSLALTMSAMPVCAVSENVRIETVKALGIMVGDRQGDLNLSGSVTRAEFVTMMTAASQQKDSVGTGTGGSFFNDVKSGHWASAYIELAVEENWMSGYSDGSFRPERGITLEEACTALLRLLGYDSGSLNGSYPHAQLSKAKSVGLLDGVSAAQGEKLTRQDCVDLFYALLLSETASGSVYGTVQGYTIKNGELDYAALVMEQMKGPYVTTNGQLKLPFDKVSAVYRDGLSAQLSDVSAYDVYYYNAGLGTVWICSEKATGTLSGVTPNRLAPTAVTVAGKEYTIGTAAAGYALSSLGGFAEGSVVTLLLGMDGEVVDVVSAAEVEKTYYGIVVSSLKGVTDHTTATGQNASVQITTQVACTDGMVRTFYHSGGLRNTGSVVSVTVGEKGVSVETLSRRKLHGTVNRGADKLGSYLFAEDVEILDFDDNGNYVRIYPERLAGVYLNQDDVYYYHLDENGEIDKLLLSEVTGDLGEYVYVTRAQSSGEGMNISGSYTYIQDGQSKSISGSTVYAVEAGGALLKLDGNSVTGMRQLSKASIEELNLLNAMDRNGKTYALADEIQVFLRSGSEYYRTEIGQINTEEYVLTGWYDNFGYAAGGRIRILTAVPRE